MSAAKNSVHPLVRVSLVWTWVCPHCGQKQESGVLGIDRSCNTITPPEGDYQCPDCRKWYELTESDPNAEAETSKRSGDSSPAPCSPWKCLHCGKTFRYEEDAIVHSNNCKRSPANSILGRK